MVKAEDMGKYFRVPADNRDLNYSKYFTEGNAEIQHLDEYNSDNTHQVTMEELKEMMLKLPYVKKELASHNSKKNALDEVANELV